MAISFRCPNGHKLTCPDQRAGQAGKCPKCGSGFHVPVLEQAQTEEALVGVAVSDEAAEGGSGVGSVGGSGVSTSPSVGEGSGPQFADGAPESPDPETIVFLCPNGHKLNAPIRLQGKPGKCPHCGEKFLVPLLDDVAQVSESGAFYDLLGEQSNAKANEVKEAKPAPTPHDSGFSFGGLAPEDEFTAGLIESSPQAMANLFARLWSQRGETGVVEIYLKGDTNIYPHWYAPQLSQHAFGMFAVQEQDGTHTLMVVRWDAIECITLRGLPQLPDGVFET